VRNPLSAPAGSARLESSSPRAGRAQVAPRPLPLFRKAAHSRATPPDSPPKWKASARDLAKTRSAADFPNPALQEFAPCAASEPPAANALPDSAAGTADPASHREREQVPSASLQRRRFLRSRQPAAFPARAARASRPDDAEKPSALRHKA